MPKNNKITPHRHNGPYGPTTDLSVYKDVVIPEEIEKAKVALHEQYLGPYGLDIPAYAMKWFYEAALAVGPKEKADCLEKARQKMEHSYLGAWARGAIKVDTKDNVPMPDEVKKQLKELNKQRREEAKIVRAERDARRQELDRADGKEPGQKKAKVPVFQDPDAQKLVLAKYPHVIPGSFKPDPDKSGGTILDIACQAKLDGCFDTRTIHLADAFQCKMCISCRAKK